MFKKAQVGEVLHDSTAFLAAFFLVVIFLIISLAFASSNQKLIQENGNVIQDKLRLDTYLQGILTKEINVNVNGENQKVSVSELFSLSQTNTNLKSYLDNIQIDLETFCKKFNKERTLGCVAKFQEVDSGCPTNPDKGTQYLSCFLIPSNKNIALTILVRNK